jgi:hypothetical protein
MVEDVEGLPACLNPITLFEREVLEDRDVPVFEALVVESVDNRLSEVKDDPPTRYQVVLGA